MKDWVRNGVQHWMRKPNDWLLRCFPIPDLVFSFLCAQEVGGRYPLPWRGFWISFLFISSRVSYFDALKSNWAFFWSLGSPEPPSLSITLVSLDQSGNGNPMGQESEKKKKSCLLEIERKKETFLCCFGCWCICFKHGGRPGKGKVIPYQRCIEL